MPSKRELIAMADEILRSNGSKELCQKRISDPAPIIDISKYLRNPLLQSSSVYIPKKGKPRSPGSRQVLCPQCYKPKCVSSWVCADCRHENAVKKYQQERFRGNEVRSAKATVYEQLFERKIERA
jgi:hypothetical protein